MKTKVYIAGLLCLLLAASSHAQIIAEELRPFDFSDKYYQVNGVIPSMLIGRKNGADKESVFDFANDRRYSNVRITERFRATTAAARRSSGTITPAYQRLVSPRMIMVCTP